MNTLDAILTRKSTRAFKNEQITEVALASNNDLKKVMGIPDGFTLILGAVFGYAVTYEPPKTHTISLNRV